jgi:hypothetical protein
MSDIDVLMQLFAGLVAKVDELQDRVTALEEGRGDV